MRFKFAQTIPNEISELLNPKSKNVEAPKKTLPGEKPSSKVYGGHPDIKAMQEKIVELARIFTSQRANLKPIEPGRPKSPNSVADYLSDNYLGAQTDKINSPAGALQRLSDPEIASFPIDGKWGPKTNAALNHIIQFAESLLKLANDFKLRTLSYNEESLKEFRSLIPEKDELSILRKIQVAPKISQHLSNVEGLFQEINQLISNNPTYQAQIEGKKEEKASILPPQVLEALNNKYKFDVSFTTQAGVLKKSISIKDLSSPEMLTIWQQQNMPQIPLRDIISQVKKQVASL